jgi:hypothetical protein
MASADFAIRRFFTKFKTDPADAAKTVSDDWVELCPVGSADRSVVTYSIRSLQRLQPATNRENPAVEMAHRKWDLIRPAYEAWKAGNEMPETGTPLAAWNAVRAEQADILRVHGIKTVEEIAALTDAHMRIPVPNLRDLKRQAQMFLDSADQVRFAARLTEKDQELARVQDAAASQQEEIDEQRKQIAALMAQVNTLAGMVAEQKDEATETKPGKSKKAA